MGFVRYVFAVLAVGLLGAADVQGEDPLPVIKGIRVVSAGDSLGVEITADRQFVYNCYKMAQLQKVIVDLPETEPGRPETLYKVKSDLIQTIKLQKKTINEAMLTRITISLHDDADFTVVPDPDNAGRVTIYLTKAHPARSPEPARATGARGDGTKAPQSRTSSSAPEKPQANAAPQAGGEGAGTGITFSADSIDIECSAPVDFKSFRMERPERLIIDLPATACAFREVPVPANRWGISRVRIGQHNSKVRLVFDAKHTLPRHDLVRTQRGLRVLFQ